MLGGGGWVSCRITSHHITSDQITIEGLHAWGGCLIVLTEQAGMRLVSGEEGVLMCWRAVLCCDEYEMNRL